MRTWDVFFPDVLPDVLGCPEPTVERHLVRAARDFCSRSRCWREDLEPIITAEGAADYDVFYCTGAEGVEFIGATLGGKDIGLEVTDGTSMAARLAGNAGRSRILSQDMLSVKVMPTPGAGVSLVLAAILRPTQAATGVPDFIGDKYRMAIADGALSTLLMVNKADWANPTLAAAKKLEFDKAIASTASRMWKANTNRQRRTVTNYF